MVKCLRLIFKERRSILNSKLKKRIILFFVLNISVLTVALIYNFLFKKELIGSCIFLFAYGFYCPGCGGSRSLNALLDFNILKSFIYYPPILIASLLLLYTDYRVFISIVTKDEEIRKLDSRIFIIIPISIIIQFAVKNILLLFGIDILGNVL